MGITYPAFFFKPRVAFLVVLIALFCIPGYTKADDSLYRVEGVKVDVTAENSVAARDQAFAKAQIDAFKVLADRMIVDGQGEAISPDPVTISSMVKDFEVTDEQLSAVRYMGTYTFRFDEAAVSQYFSSAGKQFITASSKPLLVLPFYQAGGQDILWSEGNPWMSAWGRAQFPQDLVPVEIPIGDLMDVSDIGESQALNYDRARLTNMLSRYNAGEAALMIAVPDETLAAAANDEAKGAGTLTINIYRTDRGMPEPVQNLSVTAQGEETRGQTYDRAVTQAYQALQTDWKYKSSSISTANSVPGDSSAFLQPGGNRNIRLQVPIASIREWVGIQQSLKNVPGISGFSVVSLTPREARVEFAFPGGETMLREMLARSDLEINAIGQDQSMSVYTLTRGESAPPGNGDFFSEMPQAQSNDVHTF